MHTINNATTFLLVTDAAVGSGDPSCISDVCFCRQTGDENLDTSRALWHKRGLKQRVIKFFVAHVSTVGYPVLFVQYNAQLFQQTSISLGILWFRCPRRLDVTAGYANVRNCVTLWSVCSRTCQVTTCIRFPWAVESLHCGCEPDVFRCCVRDAVTIMFTTRTL